MQRSEVREKEEGRQRAIIISISEYSNDHVPPLDFCKKNGEEMYNLLKALGYEILDTCKLIGYVKFDAMREAIIRFFTDINNKSKDTLLFYYSGHGIPAPDGDVCLASSEINPDDPYRKGFSFDELTKMLQKSVSARIVTILDCFYAGAAKISK